MKFRNWIKYEPSQPKYGTGVIYFKDEDGNDWNDSYPNLKRKYKFTYETETGVIRSVSEEAGWLSVSGMSVSDTETLPDGFDIIGGWVYNGKEIIKNTELIKENAILKKENLLNETEKNIKIIERAIRLGIATDAEKETLNALEKYSIELSRIDTENPQEIIWPSL